MLPLASSSTLTPELPLTGIDWLDAPLSCAQESRVAAISVVLRQRAERMRAASSSKPFHAKKVAAIRAEGKDEMAYWIDLVPQLVQLPLEA